jgi:hypothetical protein
MGGGAQRPIEWRQIPGLPHYDISEFGDVRRNRRAILTPFVAYIRLVVFVASLCLLLLSILS